VVPCYDPLYMPWDPLRDMRAWQERLEHLTTHHRDAWAPPIDVYETADRYVIAAELPGLAREQIELAFEDSRLTIRGQRHDRSPGGEPVHYHQVERGHGAFARTFEFGEPIAVEAVSADLTNGVLTVILPKMPSPPIRKIEVR
jgi:HSP20 family protein